ncbi:uncharacterized protein YALI1_F25987g [Yarrowia lipolytica]|uniref:Uncharacterized protein n=1 Tax=Yarrowia lipolytica TaxID=4952 RepID=A0A1D8NP70_YARLL|nr:hypothetical protein YALI1_F25987g [Yarrowia lipolytica]
MEWTRDTVKTEPPEAWLMHRHCPVFHIYRNKVPNWFMVLVAQPWLKHAMEGKGGSKIAICANQQVYRTISDKLISL